MNFGYENKVLTFLIQNFLE